MNGVITDLQVVFRASTAVQCSFFQVLQLDATEPARPKIPGRFSAPMKFTTFDTGTQFGTDWVALGWVHFKSFEDVNDPL